MKDDFRENNDISTERDSDGTYGDFPDSWSSKTEAEKEFEKETPCPSSEGACNSAEEDAACAEESAVYQKEESVCNQGSAALGSNYEDSYMNDEIKFDIDQEIADVGRRSRIKKIIIAVSSAAVAVALACAITFGTIAMALLSGFGLFTVGSVVSIGAIIVGLADSVIMQDDVVETTPITDVEVGIGAPITVHKVRADSNVQKRDMPITDVVALVADSVVEITTEVSSYGLGFSTGGSAGSGVIISDNGYIITNHHVIEDASSITVRLTDGREFPAGVVGSNSDEDIALIKIDATELCAATIGSSRSLVVGQQVLAIGNPLGTLGGTVTNGIISALDRTITIDGKDMTVLQTNAAINPGNSGGGLFNCSGELIGVVNAKRSETGIEGLGFAIPMDKAWEVVLEIVQPHSISVTEFHID